MPSKGVRLAGFPPNGSLSLLEVEIFNIDSWMGFFGFLFLVGLFLVSAVAYTFRKARN